MAFVKPSIRGRFVVAAMWSLAVLATMLAVPNTRAQDAPTRIGYVDMKRLLDQAPQVIAQRAALAREFAARDEQMKADQRRLADLESRLQHNPSDSVNLEQNELQTSLRAEASALRHSIERTGERLRSELKRRAAEETDRAWPLLEGAIADYAREHNYDLIIPSPVIYASGRVDITDGVLDALRQNQAPVPED